nr:reverse transcriptase domain-containing protein [Tanacetum cinerariifolium]
MADQRIMEEFLRASTEGYVEAIVCLATAGNTFPELRDNIQGYVAAAAINYNQEETLMDRDLAEYTIKVPYPLVQKPSPHSQRNFIVHQRDLLHPNIPYSSRMLKPKQQEKDEVQIHKFWQMFKQLQINITLADALILIPKYQKMLKALLSNKEKLLELANTPLNENCSAVILKKLSEKLRDPGKFLILCGFNELKCKALADLAGIARDVFVLVGKFTFPANFVIVNYESDPRVPLILVRLFLQTARALIDVHGEEMILRDEGGNVLTEKLLDLDPTKNLHPPHNDNQLSGSTTSFSFPNHLLEEFANELALIIFPSGNDDIPFDIDKLADLNDNLVDTMPEIFTDEHALDYSSPSERKSKESKLLIDELDLPSDFLPSFEYDSFLSKDFSKFDALPSTNNEDKVFNPGILIRKNIFKVITRVAPDKNVKKLAISHASLILEDFDPPLYELSSFKEVPSSKTLHSFSSENEEKVFKQEILTSKEVHSFFIPELSHQGYKVFKIIKILKSLLKNFLFSHGEDIYILDVPCLHFYPP